MTQALMTLAEIDRMADALYKSGFYHYKNKEQAFVLLLLCQAEGRHPMQVTRVFDIIDGKPAKKAIAMHEDFLAMGGEIEWHQMDEKIAEATFTPPNGKHPLKLSWTLAYAQHVGIANKNNWRYSRSMLSNRLLTEGIRRTCPKAASGMYTPEEIRDVIDIEKEPAISVEQAPSGVLLALKDKVSSDGLPKVNVPIAQTDDDVQWLLNAQNLDELKINFIALKTSDNYRLNEDYRKIIIDAKNKRLTELTTARIPTSEQSLSESLETFLDEGANLMVKNIAQTESAREKMIRETRENLNACV